MDGKYDLYRMSDRKDLVEFVNEVKQYPCLYDKTIPEYTNKIHNRRAWTTIAMKANTTVPDCRDKWRKIRISFLRSLKQQQSDKPPLRPYYLTEELNFLLPFLTVHPKNYDGKEIQSPTKEDKMDYECSFVKHEISDSDSDPLENDSVENGKETNRIAVNNNSKPQTTTNSIENGDNNKQNGVHVIQNGNHIIENGDHNTKQNVDHIKQNGEHIKRNGDHIKQNGDHIKQNGDHKKQHGARIHDDIEGNPRKMFLLSMLPDIESFTESEMRIFRREVINVIDNIIIKRS